FTSIGIGFCYAKIYLAYVFAQNKAKQNKSESEAHSRVQSLGPQSERGLLSTVSASEKMLLIKSLVITFCFASLWTPYLIMIMIEMVTQVRPKRLSL
ncbi:hypothetical protein HDU91_001894, partial [Kappamyces sp. JEL0680]